MTNPNKGEVTLKINNSDYDLCYDWSAIGELRSSFSDEALQEIVNGSNIDGIAKVLSIGFKKKHPEMTVEKIMEMSPPFILAVQAIDQALTVAYFGASEPEQGEPEKKE